MAENNENMGQNAGPAEAEMADRKAVDNTATPAAKPSVRRLKVKGKGTPTLVNKAQPAADDKAEAMPAESTADMSHAPSAQDSASAPVAAVTKTKASQAKDERGPHPLALWVPLIAVGAFAWFMHNTVQGPTTAQKTNIIAGDASSGVKTNALTPPTAGGRALTSGRPPSTVCRICSRKCPLLFKANHRVARSPPR